MADIFVSYATEDRERVAPIIEAIEKAGFSVWWDRKLITGPSYSKAIRDQLDAARCVVVVWTRHSITSDWCLDEANDGLQRAILVPILIDDVRVPLGFGQAQTASMIGWPEFNNTTALINGIRACLVTDEAQGTSTEMAVPADETTNVSAILSRNLGEISLAVLPFENLSGDPNKDYFSDSVTDALINRLAQIDTLKVISRTSTMRFKGQRAPLRQIAEALGARRIIEGSVVSTSDRVRIAVQLIDVDSDALEWSASYDRELIDILAVQDEIAQSVFEQVGARIAPQPIGKPRGEKVNSLAYDEYLRGRHLISQLTAESVGEGIELIKRCIALAPDYAPAHAAIADAYVQINQWGQLERLGNHLEEARRAAETAVRLDPNLADAYYALARVEYADWNWSGAELGFQRAVALNASLSEAYRNYALLMTLFGRDDAAIGLAERAVALAPLATPAHDDLGRAFYRAGRFEEAIAEHRRAHELDPSYEPVLSRLIDTYVELGRREEAIAVLDEMNATRLYRQITEGRLLAKSGEVDAAREAAARLEASRWTWSLIFRVEIYARIGDIDMALDLLEQAVNSRSVPPYVLRNPCHRPMVDHPRYQNLLKLAGLFPD